MYEFLAASDPTAMRVTVSDATDERLLLRFIQAERPLVRNGDVFLRPQTSFEIELTMTENGRLMEGTVVHPTRRRPGGEDLVLAKAVLIPLL